MANAHNLTDHVHHIFTGTLELYSEQEILAGLGIMLAVLAVSAICAPFLNPAQRGD